MATAAIDRLEGMGRATLTVPLGTQLELSATNQGRSTGTGAAQPSAAAQTGQLITGRIDTNTAGKQGRTTIGGTQ